MKKIINILLFVLLPILGFTQGPPGGFPNGGPPLPPNAPCQFNCIPIDQGSIFLIIFGILLGIFLLNKRKVVNNS